VIGMLRYDKRKEGNLAVGNAAPDVSLTALDGTTRVGLRERIGKKPVILVFGSYT
jgi:peroxiredoxin